MKKTAIITGGAIRVGKAISLALAKDGYDIALIYNSSAAEAKNTAKEIEKLKVKCSIYKCDISKLANIKKTFSEIFKKHKHITLLVNNASIFERHSMAETTEDIYDRHFDINLKAPFFITQEYYNYCKKSKIHGHTVNILDSYILSNNPSHFAYLLTKKALFEFTKMSALELGPVLRVNGVSIGLLLPSEDWSQSKIDKRVETTPLKKKTTLKNITDTILFLNNNDNITGNNILVDSGLNLKH